MECSNWIRIIFARALVISIAINKLWYLPCYVRYKLVYSVGWIITVRRNRSKNTDIVWLWLFHVACFLTPLRSICPELTEKIILVLVCFGTFRSQYGGQRTCPEFKSMKLRTITFWNYQTVKQTGNIYIYIQQTSQADIKVDNNNPNYAGIDLLFVSH